VNGNVLLMEWSVKGIAELPMAFALPHFDAEIDRLDNGLCAAIHQQAFVAMLIDGADALTFEAKARPLACDVTIGIDAARTVCMALAFGYEAKKTLSLARAALATPAAHFAAAEKTWDDFFTRVVPRFECSNKRVEKLYYYQAYTTRANLYDIPFEPFTHPYTCPWKTGAVWQWSWNTPMNSVAERWLNDPTIGAGGVLLERDNGGGLNIGSYLHPTKKVRALRSRLEHAQTLGGYLNELPKSFDMIACTTIPHTTPNGLLGAWEFYRVTGDKKFLRGAFETMLEAEKQFSKHELASGLYATSFVDEFDYSLRLKPYIKAFAKGDPEMMLKMDTPFIAIDYNCYLYALRQAMIAAAGELKVKAPVARWARQNETLRAAIRQHLWDDVSGYYYDADPRTMQRSNVKALAAFSAMYAGIADASQAQRMVQHLKNKKEFATNYPCPSVAMDTPEVDPSLITYGGDIEITSGVWFTVEALVRYGYTDLAAEIVARTIAMMTIDGPSSSYSYHCRTGAPNQDRHTLASQGTIVTDLICRYIVGLTPTAGRAFELNPLALKAAGVKHFTFGPYRAKGQSVTVTFANGKLSMKIRAAH
jgi:hypothetical protein